MERVKKKIDDRLSEIHKVANRSCEIYGCFFRGDKFCRLSKVFFLFSIINMLMVERLRYGLEQFYFPHDGCYFSNLLLLCGDLYLDVFNGKRRIEYY